MPHGEFRIERSYLIRVDHDSDLVEFITKFAKDRQITKATFTAIGALKTAKLGFYDQQALEYGETQISKPTEIASCIGNISIKDGAQFVHAHAVLTNHSGKTWGGHLLGGIVFAAEIHLTELAGENVIRMKDDVTGLALWNL